MEPSLKTLKNTFLLCGYPRSRTLWLANFFTIPEVSLCQHEALEFAASSQEFWKNAEVNALSSNVHAYGNSDSSNIMVLPALLARQPLTKVIWIERPLLEVRASMLNAGFVFPSNVEKTLLAYRNAYEELFDAAIPYPKLAEMTTMRGLWQLVLPDVPFDYGRWGQLAGKVMRYDSSNYDLFNPDRVKKLIRFIQTEGEEIVCPL